MRTCAVIVAAYRAERWIEEMIQSFHGQLPLLNWRYELRIGTDGCRSTAAELRRLGQPHWRPRRKAGCYVLRNSLVQLAPADAYAIFDADDRMRPAYLRTLLAFAGHRGIAGPGRFDIDQEGNKLRASARPWGHGVCVISAHAWARLGGYRSYECAADSDLHRRARQLRIPTHGLRRGLFDRRVHPAQLTQDAELGRGTAYRSWTQEDSIARARAGELHIIPETVRLHAWPRRPRTRPT